MPLSPSRPTTAQAGAAASTPVRVWDLPTRVFHWTLAVAIVGSVLSAKIGGDAMSWHFRLGYLVCALLAFRLVWGLVGGHWSRFTQFIYAPSTLWRYVNGRTHPGQHLDVGHNPLGAMSVFAMLALLMVQVGTGLVADDEIANLGPLNRFVSGATALSATAWHKSWGQWLILALVGLHLAAIGFYSLRGHGLVQAMWRGDKALPPGTPASADGKAPRLLALVLALGCVTTVLWLVSLGG